MNSLRVLIANVTLASRTGTETYVRDLALGLLRKGHLPFVYSPQLGPIADELRQASIPVVDDLDRLSVEPDIIHGNHHAELVYALLRYQRVPAIHVCHAWLSDHDLPPRLDRIRRYVAIDHTVRDRLLFEQGIPEDQIRIHLNSVDTNRFLVRSSLPNQLRKALIFSNYAHVGPFIDLVRQACQSLQIELDVIGNGVGNAINHPETILGQYDLVFAKARCALEAIASGCAVILCDPNGMGEMVSSENWEMFRRWNFGIRTLQTPPSFENLVREIQRYDPHDASQVSRQIRSFANADLAIEELGSLYREVIEEHRQCSRDTEQEILRLSGYLRWVTRLAYDDLQRYEQCVQAQQKEIHRLQEESTYSANEHRACSESMKFLSQERERLERERDHWVRDYQLLRKEWDALVTSTQRIAEFVLQRRPRRSLLGRLLTKLGLKR